EEAVPSTRAAEQRAGRQARTGTGPGHAKRGCARPSAHEGRECARMDHLEPARQLAELLEQGIWDDSALALHGPEAGLPVGFRPLGCTVRDVLAQVSDEGLVVALQKGFLVREAFEELLENRCKNCLFRWSYHWGLTIPDAEDLVHDLFARFLQTRFASYE